MKINNYYCIKYNPTKMKSLPTRSLKVFFIGILTFLFIIVFLPFLAIGQTTYNINDVNNQVIFLNQNNGEILLYDSGGPVNPYGNNEDFSVTICNEEILTGCPPIRIWASLTNLDIPGAELCSEDYLELLGEHPDLPRKMCNDNTSVTPFNPGIFSSEDGCITVNFKSNEISTGGGFSILFKTEDFYSYQSEQLTCGSVAAGDVQLFNGSPGCFGCVYNYDGCSADTYIGAEEVWYIDPNLTGPVNITVSGQEVDFFVYAYPINTAPPGCVRRQLIECGIGNTETVTIDIDPNSNFRDYFIVVDAQFGSSYTIGLSCGADPCELAPELECDVIYEESFFQAPSQISAYDCSPDFFNLNERIFTFTPSESKEYTFNAKSLNGFLHPDLFLLDCCSYTETGGEVPYLIIGENCTFCNQSETNALQSELTVFLQAGVTYYLFAEKKQNAPNDFLIWIECETNDVCNESIPITCNQNYFGNLSGVQNKVTRYQCGPGGSILRLENSEYIYTFTPTITQNYTFNALSASGTSPAIIISNCCDVGNNSEPDLSCSFLDCSYFSDLGITRNSALLTAGVTYYIFVETASINTSPNFVFWVNCDCNLFAPLADQSGNNIIFENNSPGTYVSHTIKFPFDENGQNYTYTDSLSQINGDGTITCHFPFPGCYEVCFYYRVNNQVIKCCFKYCPIIKKYDCVYPIIEEVSMTNNSSTIRVTCEDGGMVGKNSLMMEDICLIKVKPTNGTTISEYRCGSDINLPHGEYEVCCWQFDPVCQSWQVCCKIICLPYIPPAELACGNENILVEKLSPTEYKYTWSGSQDGLEWTIMPSVNFTTNGNMMTARYPGPGVYKVCGIGLTNMGTIILRDTCCVYTCIDNEPEVPCENSFRVIPLPNNKARLVCTVGRPVLRWEVTYLEGLAITTVYYGDSPIIDLFPNSTYDIKKVFAGCCGTEESCTKRFCYTDPFDCTFIMPRYLGGPGDLSLEYGFNIPDDLVGVEWRIDELDMVIGENTRSVSYNFLTPGCYTISVLIYDPVNECYVICCKRICITYPYDCTLLKHWFRGNEGNSNIYTIELNSDCTEPMRQMSDIKWSINGIHYPEYDGLSTLNDIDLSFYGQPGTDVFICAMFYDPCLDACRWCYLKIRLEPPFNCNEFTPLFQSENQYTFTANGNYETTYWMIGGIDGVCFGEGLTTFDLNDPTIQEYITLVNPDYIYVYFYYRVGFCWKVCCKRICLKGPNGCEEFGDECDYFRPIYNEDFENGPPLGYGYMEGDSININMDWWKGQGIVENAEGKIGEDEILCLTLNNTLMDNVNVLKVSFDFKARWKRNLITGQYDFTLQGGVALCKDSQGGGTGQCYSPTLHEILDNNPGLLMFCGIGSDEDDCTHKMEILIDRSGPIEMFIDGRKVNYTGIGGNNWENLGAIIDKINFDGGNLYIDNVCVAECMECQPPTVDPGDFFPCNDVGFVGFGFGGDNSITGLFSYNGSSNGEGWVVKEVDGQVMTTVYEDFSGATSLNYPGFIPGRTYIVCFKYLDENGCVQYCCYKLTIPSGCGFVKPKYDGGGSDLTYQFMVDAGETNGLEPFAWYVEGEQIGGGELTAQYTFPFPGKYNVYCVFWDPVTRCYVWCCKSIIVGYPYECNLIKYWFTGSETNPYEYTIQLESDCSEPMRQFSEVTWTINGIERPEFDGLMTLANVNLSNYGQPGTDIIICAMFYDPCLKACRWCYFKIRLDLPFNCDQFIPIFISENNYEFISTLNFFESYWMIGGLEGVFFAQNSFFFDLSLPEIQNYISQTGVDFIYIYQYYKIGDCWNVCCKKICLKGPDECEEFGEECDYFRPIYNEDFENGPPLGFGYTFGDSININTEWWRGHGGVVDADFTSQSQNAGHIKGDNILQLHFDNAQTANIQILKVAYEISLEWSRDLMTGNYGTGSLDGDIFICSDVQCYGPSINDLILNTNLFKFCNNGGGDRAYCSHRIEILIDRSGPVEMFVDGRKVPSPNGFEDKGDIISSLSIGGDINGGIRIDNVCIAECMTCQPPTVDPGDFFPCDDIVLNGFGSGGNNAISGQFTYNGTSTGEGWVIKEVLGTVMTTVYEDFSGSTTLSYPGFLPGRTYIVCFKYFDENGCLQYCCYKVNIPDGCHYYTPYFAGDNDPENLTFDFVLENPNPDGLELVAWYVGDTKVADNVSTLTYRFPGQGTYYVYCVFWDPLTKCYVWCCRRICVEYPLNCDRIIIDYDGANNEYILSAEGIQQIISWNIDIPAGLPNRGYIGMDNPQRFNPADFGILPGQEIVISVRYIDADGCLKICCRRICIPVTTPVEECNNIFPIYTGNGLQYTFEVNPSDDFEDIVWRLHIPGTNQTIDIGSGPMSDVVDFEALAVLYPTLTLDKVCISIFYRDRVTGCYKVCCKCFCIAQNPFECTSIKYYYSGSPTNPLIYNFVLDVPGAQFISWTLDNTNTFLSDQASFEVDFGTLGVTLGSEIFVTVRYYDPVSECFRICCKRLCLVDPYAGCDKITAGLPVNNLISMSTSVNNPVWTIEGLPGIYSESQNPEIDLTDPQIIQLVQGNSTINVCVVYMENGCCRVCCTPVCVLPATVNCDNFDITSVVGVNNFTFTFTDTNTGAISTEITLPNGMGVSLGGSITTYSNTLEGDYTICRNYLNGCQDTISCCQSFCLSFGLNCEPITFTINPSNDRIYTFTHNIIGGVSYLWDFGDGTTSTSDLTSVSHTYPSENRQYTVCLTVTDECGTFCQQCRDIAVGEINFSPVVVNPSCGNINDGSINLNISGGIPPVQILWSNAATTEVINNLGAGNYSVTVTDGSGKDTTFTFTLTAPELANLEATITQTSCGENNGEIRISVLNNVAIQSYSWSLASLASDSVVSMLAAGSYNVTVTDVNGCTSSLEGIIVNASEALALFNFGSDMTLCANEIKTLDVGVVNASNVTIEWFRNGDLLLSNTRTLEVSGAGTYVAVVSNSQNCVRRDTIIVNYFDDVIELPEDRIDIDLDEVVTLEVIGAISAEWLTTDAELSCTSCLLTTFTFLQNTTIIVTATDANGCTKTDTIELRFDTSPIDGPNFITPNGDGANDVLEFENLDRFTYRKLIIFNRWGQIVRTFEGYNNDWDGTLDGRPLPDGAYYYVLRYGNITPDQYEFKSDITIIRRQ